MIHELKTEPEYFEAIQSMRKQFEVRKDDRMFNVGDFLGLNEYTAEHGYTGRSLMARIIYILKDPAYCKSGYWILGIVGCRVATADDWFQELEIRPRAGGIPIYLQT